MKDNLLENQEDQNKVDEISNTNIKNICNIRFNRKCKCICIGVSSVLCLSAIGLLIYVNIKCGSFTDIDNCNISKFCPEYTEHCDDNSYNS